jgi:hypothetical protein
MRQRQIRRNWSPITTELVRSAKNASQAGGAIASRDDWANVSRQFNRRFNARSRQIDVRSGHIIQRVPIGPVIGTLKAQIAQGSKRANNLHRQFLRVGQLNSRANVTGRVSERSPSDDLDLSRRLRVRWGNGCHACSLKERQMGLNPPAAKDLRLSDELQETD